MGAVLPVIMSEMAQTGNLQSPFLFLGHSLVSRAFCRVLWQVDDSRSLWQQHRRCSVSYKVLSSGL